jgi:hypothetical protein
MRIQDDYSQLSSDRALYRFFHLGVDVGSVDVHFGSAVPEQGRQFADNNMSSLYSQYSAITPNTYEVVVKKAGTDSVIASKSSVFLEGRAAYTFFLRGAAGATGTNAVTLDYMQAAE